MKIKLYLVQEVYNAENPEDCVGPLHFFQNPQDRDWWFISKINNEYCSYQTFEKEIEVKCPNQ